MKNILKVALVAAAGLLAIGGAAIANNGRWQHMGGHGQMGFTGLAERYDANKDGKISQEEIDTNRTGWITEFDADKSGSMTLAEFQHLWLKARNVDMVREFQRFDRDGNGQVTADEYKSPMSQMVSRMDRNGDGSISMDDMRGQQGKFHHRGMMDENMDDGDKDSPNNATPNAQ